MQLAQLNATHATCRSEPMSQDVLVSICAARCCGSFLNKFKRKVLVGCTSTTLSHRQSENFSKCKMYQKYSYKDKVGAFHSSKNTFRCFKKRLLLFQKMNSLFQENLYIYIFIRIFICIKILKRIYSDIRSCQKI